MANNTSAPAQTAETATSQKTNRSGGRRLRAMELRFTPVFDTHLNMALDYATTVRINDPKMGVMLPAYYGPIAAKSNRICEINRWAIEEACAVLKRAEDRGASINSFIMPLSVRYLAKPYFQTQVRKIVDKNEIGPDKFNFTIAENIYESESEQVLKNMREMREYGFLFSIDDFGVEYTSLSNLAQYEVDYIGINRSLIEPLNPEVYEDEDRQRPIVQGLIDFAKKIHCHVRVDGVDNQPLADLLAKMGADQMRGALYGTEPWEEKKIK